MSTNGNECSLLLGNYEFFGPLANPGELRPEPGILAIFAQSNDSFELLEVSESNNVRRAATFAAVSRGPVKADVCVAAHYTNGTKPEDRLKLRDEILVEFGSDC
jgi:hypothetical protein